MIAKGRQRVTMHAATRSSNVTVSPSHSLSMSVCMLHAASCVLGVNKDEDENDSARKAKDEAEKKEEGKKRVTSFPFFLSSSVRQETGGH